MNRAIVILIIAIIVVSGLTIVFYYPTSEPKPTSIEDACAISGGAVIKSSCCLTVKDFPNTCLVGACGCSLENSHNVFICDCGDGRCWDATQNKCIDL